MPNPGRNNIDEAVIRRMVTEALEAQEQEFFQTRGADSDGQLVAYLRACAVALGHTPWPREIIGGRTLLERFGTWEAALEKAKLPKPQAPDKLTQFARYQAEVERQREAYREKKAAKKFRTRQREKTGKKSNPCDPPCTDGREKLSDCL